MHIRFECVHLKAQGTIPLIGMVDQFWFHSKRSVCWDIFSTHKDNQTSRFGNFRVDKDTQQTDYSTLYACTHGVTNTCTKCKEFDKIYLHVDVCFSLWLNCQTIDPLQWVSSNLRHPAWNTYSEGMAAYIQYGNITAASRDLL